MRHSRIPPCIRAHANAAPGLLARLAAVLNPHPVTESSSRHRQTGVVTPTVRVNPNSDARADWHIQRVSARLRRVVGVTSVSVCLDDDHAVAGALPGQALQGQPWACLRTPGEAILDHVT